MDDSGGKEIGGNESAGNKIAGAGQGGKPVVVITYCTGCNWLLRAGWMAQELLQSFGTDLGGVTLVPGEIGGIFEIRAGETVIWDRKRDGGFPDARELKQRLRDLIDPARDLGHLDRAGTGSGTGPGMGPGTGSGGTAGS